MPESRPHDVPLSRADQQKLGRSLQMAAPTQPGLAGKCDSETGPLAPGGRSSARRRRTGSGPADEGAGLQQQETAGGNPHMRHCLWSPHPQLRQRSTHAYVTCHACACIARNAKQCLHACGFRQCLPSLPRFPPFPSTYPPIRRARCATRTADVQHVLAEYRARADDRSRVSKTRARAISHN